MRLLVYVCLCYFFNCKMPMQVLFQIKFLEQMSGDFLGTQALTLLEHLIF